MMSTSTANRPSGAGPFRKVVELRRPGRAAAAPRPPNKREIKTCLDEVLEALRPIIQCAEHDTELAASVISDEDFTDPLTRFDTRVLACALYKEQSTGEVEFDYADVLELTDRFAGRAMNITMVYRTISNLVERGLVDRGDRVVDEVTKRPSQKYSINIAGKEAFRLTVATAHHLRNSRVSAAA